MKKLFTSVMLDKQSLLDQAVTIERFLRTVHPFLSEENKHPIELRPIKRDEEAFIKSLNLYSLSDSELKILKEYLGEQNGVPACMYYSVFAFDAKLNTYKDDGRPHIKGLINKQNSRFTQCLVMDFDEVSREEYQIEKVKLHALGLETISIYSGHGYQDIILLTDKVNDTSILQAFTALLLKKGFKVDPRIIDASRVMRLPFTFNCKAYDKHTKYYSKTPEGILTRMESFTERRYSLEDVFKRIKSLPDILDTPDNVTSIKEKLIQRLGKSSFFSAEKQYSMLDFKKLPLAIQKMLICTRIGNRNNVLMFIIPYFKNSLKLSLFTTIEIMKIWGSNCIPSLDAYFIESEVCRIWRYDYKRRYGKYCESLKKEFGFLKIEEEAFAFKDCLVIPNKLFDNYSDISNRAVKLYLKFNFYSIRRNKYVWSTHEIFTTFGISKSSFHRHIGVLIKMGLIIKLTSYKKNSVDYSYKFISSFKFNSGYTQLPIRIAETVLFHPSKGLSDSELKLFLCLAHMGNTTHLCWASQEKIGKIIGKKRNTVCELTQSLNSKGYTKKQYISEYCVSNNIVDIDEIRHLTSEPFYEFVYNCYYEDVNNYRKHCIYLLDDSLSIAS